VALLDFTHFALHNKNKLKEAGNKAWRKKNVSFVIEESYKLKYFIYVLNPF
jgi:hypothetical protein